MVQINIQCVQSIDYTILGLMNVQVSVSDAIKFCIWCDESFAPTGLSCKLECVIGTTGFAGKAEVQPGASVGIRCLDSAENETVASRWDLITRG